jgi:uncharacterized protein (TIGR03083 family)
MSFLELDAFAEECAGAEATLRGIRGEAWSRPALGVWNMAQLVAHLVRATTRVPEYLALPVEDVPLVDRVGYWRFDADAQAPAVAQRAIDEAAAVDQAVLPERFAEGWHTTIAAAELHGPGHVLTTIMGPMRLDEYLATRVLEVVVHHMDVRMALDQPPIATPAAARLTMESLELLLGEPRPRNLGRTRFILAATGRTDTDDPRFPVLH